MSGWGCPHEYDGKCQKVLNKPCDIGMKGCVLSGRFRFADPSKNRVKKSQSDQVSKAPAQGDDKQ